MTIVTIALLLAGLVFGGQMLLETDHGRAFVVRALPLYAPRSGLRISATRIDGSIFGRMTVHDLTLADPLGVFARAPVAEVDWRPFDLIDGLLMLRSAHVADATLFRRPALRPSADKRILPDIDIVIGKLAIDRLVLAPALAGTERIVVIGGTADIRSGHALLDLSATASGGGDTARIRLDSEPDRDKFDLDAAVTAPADGIIARLFGLRAPLDVHLGGDGRWSDWRGRAVARLGSASLADLNLRAEAGKFSVAGTAAPAPLLGGAAARLTAPGMTLRVDATLKDRVVTTAFTADAPALRLTGNGKLDFGNETIDALAIDARLLRPASFNPRLVARDMRLGLHVGGTFARPMIDYALTAPAFSWGRTGFEQFRAAGRVDGGTRPVVIPVAASATRVVNVGDDIAPLLADLRIAGPLTLVRGRLASDTLAVRSARIAGRATLRLDTIGGEWNVGFDGRLPGYRVGAIGLVDLSAVIRAGPDPSGLGARVTGTVRAAGTRVDSGFFRQILSGLPVLTTAIDVAPDLSMQFTGLRLVAPGLTLAGGGTRAPDGTVRLRGSGVSRDYGPAVVDLAGPLDAPVADVALAAPGLGIGLANVTAHVTPVGGDWSFVARGGSLLGPATARGISRVGAVDLDASLAGLSARGTLAPSDAGPFGGRLALSGTGLSGSAQLTPAGIHQRADITLAASQAQLATEPAMTIGKGSLAATVVFTDTPTLTGRFSLFDLRARGVTLASASGSVDDDAGLGIVKLAARGIAGRAFDTTLSASLAPDRIEITPALTIAGRKLTVDHPARLDRAANGWTLTPVTLLTPDGRAELSGRVGDDLVVAVRLDALGLSLLDLIDPSYDFGGRASGTIAATIPATGAPTGSLSLRVAGLTRAGLATTSLPVDLAVNAVLAPTAASARAVIVRGGATLGRAQAQLTLASGVRFGDRLLAAPLFAQARFDGPAQALWLLGGVEALDVRGPVSAAIDVGGRLGDPLLSGSLTASGARLENTALGTVVDNVRLDSRFAGSRFVLTGFSGTVGKTGKVSGSGAVDLSAERNFPVDVRLDLDDAQLLDRDDLRATATGQIHLQSSGDGGRITGALTIARARFRLGRAGNADVPALTVTERNVELLGRPAPRAVRATNWQLDVAATARDNLVVIGMGLDSVWRGDVRITGRATAPELTGRVRMVRGDYDFAGKRFNLTRGDLRFPGGSTPDPVIDIAAENTSSGFTAQLALTGTALHPDIKFSSTPALPEDEVLSRVLFGTSITTLSAPEAVQLAGALASLRGGKAAGLNPIDAVRKGLRIDRLRILPADIATGRKTSIAAGQYIGRRLYVELSTDAQGYSASAIEIALTRSLSILSDVATLGGTSVNLRLKKDY